MSIDTLISAFHLKRGTHYNLGYSQTGSFVRYEVMDDVPIAIFDDFQPRVLDWTAKTEVVLGLSYLSGIRITEAGEARGELPARAPRSGEWCLHCGSDTCPHANAHNAAYGRNA